MVNEKKPSIYYDRGTIGSSDELDEYGVWVKGEPQDLSSAGMESREPADDSDPELSGMSELPDFSDLAEGAGSSGELPDDAISLDEDLELPDIDFEDGTEEAIDFGDSSADASESAGTDDAESFEINEFPEPDFSDFIESEGETGAEEDGGSEMLSGDEAETLGFAEVPMDAEDDAVVEDIRIPDNSGGKERAPKETGASSGDLSTQLLMRIADELASIRTELSTLKKELAAGAKAGTVSGENGEAQNHGFFDEEDDEKIALTGDELDNILNTADFTEEAGADAVEEAGAGFDIQEAEDNSSGPFQEITEIPPETAETGDISFDDITGVPEPDISPAEENPDEPGGETGLGQTGQGAGEVPAGQDTFPEEPIEFDITMNDGGEDLSIASSFEGSLAEETEAGDAGDGVPENLPDLEEKDSEELRRLWEAGAPVTTPAPEDTSYLEEDPLAFSEFDEESLDLSNVVIDEPDLSGEIQENPLEEPSLDDISIDLDLNEDEISLGGDKETGIEETGETGSIGEEIEEEIELPVPGESTEIAEEGFEDFSAGSADLAIIPEGFVVEAEDAGVPSVDEGEGAFPEEAGTLEPAEDAFDLEETKEEAPPQAQETAGDIPSHLKQELKTVLSYMDQLLESLPDEKIEEFAKSEYFDTYKKLFKELGLV